MKCGTVRRKLSALLDEELAAEEAEAVRAHVQSCEACAALLAGMRAADGEAGEALRRATEGVEAPRGFKARVMGAIGPAERARAPGVWRRRAWKLAVASAGVLVVAVGLWGVLATRDEGGGPGPDAANGGGGPRVTPRGGRVVLTTLDLPSVRELAEELLGGPGEAEAEEPKDRRLNYEPFTVPRTWG